jgi:4-amino-4-deoxy-L-arabinose transferase-like glycosyltransferase
MMGGKPSSRPKRKGGFREYSGSGHAWMLATSVLVMHGVLASYDLLSGFAPFLRTDRAGQRAESISRLINAANWQQLREALLRNIIPGDYLLQAVLYAGGGALAVVVFQIVLQLLAVLAVYRTAQLLLSSSRMSFAAALIYACLPHSIVLAHQLSSEALAVPLVAIGYWLVMEVRVGGKPTRRLLIAGAMLGLAACVRPVLALLPIIVAPLVARPRSPRAAAEAASFAAAGTLPLLLWAAFFSLSTHQLSLGNMEVGTSLGGNLRGRVVRIAASLPPDQQVVITGRYLDRNSNGVLSVADYLSFVAQYPRASLQHALRDMVTLAAKSGMSRLTIDYLDLAPRDADQIQSWGHGWRANWESRGLVAAIQAVRSHSPAIVIPELIGAILFSALFSCSLLGILFVGQLVKTGSISNERKAGFLLLTLLIVCVFATSQVGDAAQSRLRYPAEFAICILAVFGAMRALTLSQRSRMGQLRDGARSRLGDDDSRAASRHDTVATESLDL